jgi:hypothetical protein
VNDSSAHLLRRACQDARRYPIYLKRPIRIQMRCINVCHCSSVDDPLRPALFHVTHDIVTFDESQIPWRNNKALVFP